MSVLATVYALADRLQELNTAFSTVEVYKDTLSVQNGGLNDNYTTFAYIRYRRSATEQILVRKKDHFSHSMIHRLVLVAQLASTIEYSDALDKLLGQLASEGNISITGIGMDQQKISEQEFGKPAKKDMNLLYIAFDLTDSEPLQICEGIC